MKKLLLIYIVMLGANAMQAQTMYVRPTTGSQTAYPVANIKKLTFNNGNLVVTNDTGPNGTFALAENRYINFTDLTLVTNNPMALKNKFYVYPNPTNQWLNIGNSNPTQTPSLVEVVSIDGKLLIQQKPLTADTQIDISSLPKGIYLCRISSNNLQETLKFLKQ